MSTEIALDTSVVIQIFDDDPVVKKRFDDVEITWMPVPVIGEIAVGFSDSSPYPSQRSDFETFLASMKIIECTLDVGLKYGAIHRHLRRNGAMIPINDIWIAACCLVAGLPLATRDPHFQRVPDLRVEMW